MHISKTITDIRKIRSALQGSVGFIPTMGYLHEGHISLVEKAQKENDHVIVSIFVNPKQFGPHEDFQKYPRDPQKDLTLLEKAKTDIVFMPSVEQLYPEDFETYVELKDLPTKLEGAIRPGHFTGVATVLTKLFHIVEPTRSYFGQKDAQQVAVVKKMVLDLNFPTEIVVSETVREADGLAMSSRNVFLNDKERKEATILFQSLSLAKEMAAKGETDSKKIKKAMEKILRTTSGVVDYISIADQQTLNEIETVKNGTLVSLAVRFGTTRLIDNVIIK